MSESFEIIAPDDFHVHLRDGHMLRMVAPHTAKHFRRALVMPNLVPPTTSVQAAKEYRHRILEAVGSKLPHFEPLMTLYLTGVTSPDDIRQAAADGTVKAVKYYPAGATTNSDAGVSESSLEQVYPTLRAMAEVGMPLCVHGETTDPDVDVFDREAVFIDRVLRPLVAAIPNLKLIVEHITTEDGVRFVEECGPNVAATITVQHMLMNRNALFTRHGRMGLRPHHYCLPVLKAEQHRKALVRAATSGNPKFFAGTDTAPHARSRKECECGCAGCFTSPVALPLYAEVFATANALPKLEGFLSVFGAQFYGLPKNTGRVRFTKKDHVVPNYFPVESMDDVVVPLLAGETVHWHVDVLD